MSKFSVGDTATMKSNLQQDHGEILEGVSVRIISVVGEMTNHDFPELSEVHYEIEAIDQNGKSVVFQCPESYLA